MANLPPIQFKRSTTSEALPLPTDLQVGELALNLADGKIYTKDAASTIISVSGSGADVAYQDFVVGNAVGDNINPSFTITDTDLNAITNPNDLYVMFEGFPLTSDAYTFTRPVADWVITLSGDSDYAGSTYRAGDVIRVSNGNVFQNTTSPNLITYQDAGDDWAVSESATGQAKGSSANVINYTWDSSVALFARAAVLAINVTGRAFATVVNLPTTAALENDLEGTFNSTSVPTAHALMPFFDATFNTPVGTFTPSVWEHATSTDELVVAYFDGTRTYFVILGLDWTGDCTMDVWQDGVYSVLGDQRFNDAGIAVGVTVENVSDYFLSNVSIRYYGLINSKIQHWIKVRGPGYGGINSLSTARGFTGTAPTGGQAWVFMSGTN